MGRRSTDIFSPQQPHKKAPQAWKSTVRKHINNTNFSFRSKVSELHITHSQPLYPVQERQAPKMTGFENQWGSHPGKPQNVNDENLLLKGCTNLTALGSSNKTPVGKSPRLYVKETHLLILKQILERQEFIRTLSWDRSTGRCHFWYFIQTCNICSDRHILDLSH